MENLGFFGEKEEFKTNFYEILGCDRSSTFEQISTEYKIKALKLHPDKNSNKEDSQNQFKILQEAKEILLDSKLRKKYDLWLDGNFGMSWNEWRKFTEKTSPVFHWVNKDPQPMIMPDDESSQNCREKTNELSNFRFNSKQNDPFLLKFRNYQI